MEVKAVIVVLLGGGLLSKKVPPTSMLLCTPLSLHGLGCAVVVTSKCHWLKANRSGSLIQYYR